MSLQGKVAIVTGASVSRAAEARKLFDATFQRFGRLDILVNNAGTI